VNVATMSTSYPRPLRTEASAFGRGRSPPTFSEQTQGYDAGRGAFRAAPSARTSIPARARWLCG
jgi:hypothetical protein